jgi:hypothetical protein
MQLVIRYRLTLLGLCCLALCITGTYPAIFPEPEQEPAPTALSPLLCQALQPLQPGELPTFNFTPQPPPRITAPPPPPVKVGRDWKVPRNLVKGILYVETRSILRPDDTVKYVDRRVGQAGERGPTQIKRMTFEQVAKPGEKFERLQRDTQFALDVTERYLTWLRSQTHSWAEAVAAWNVGTEDPSKGRRYRQEVMEAAAKLAFLETQQDPDGSLFASLGYDEGPAEQEARWLDVCDEGGRDDRCDALCDEGGPGPARPLPDLPDRRLAYAYHQGSDQRVRPL